MPDDVDWHAASHGAACCYPACCYPACCVSGGCVIDSTSTAAFPGPGAAQRSLAFAGAVLAAASVGLLAYASHVAVGAGQAALLTGARSEETTLDIHHTM